MSPASVALSSGFSALLVNNGEPLILTRAGADKGTPGIPALVDRSPDQKRYAKELNFDAERASVIELFQTAVTPEPKVGDEFQDDALVFHRIQKVHPLDGFKLRCFCSSSK